MDNVKVSFDRMSYSSKPEGSTIAGISNRIGNQIRQLDSERFRGFAGDIGLDGHTFCPATFKNGKRKKENLDQIQLFVLDFDNETPDKHITFDSVKERAHSHNLPILFAYESFSSQNKDRFRVVFFNDVPIKSVNDAEVIQDALVTMFPECDKSSKDISKMYFGGSKDQLLFFNKEIPKINVISAITGMTSYLEERYRHNYGRKVSEFIKNHGLKENDSGMPDVSVVYELPKTENNAELSGVSADEKISPNSTTEHNLSIIEGFGEKFSKKYYLIKYANDTRISAQNVESKRRHEFRSRDIPKIHAVCQLFREFEAGSKRLSHDELFGLATNLTNVETGEKLFLKLFKANAYADGRIGKYGYWAHQIKKYITGYKPQSCSNFHCRYCNSCPHGTNILSTAKLKYHQLERIAGYNEPLYTLEEAEKDFKQTFANAMNDERKMWFIIKAQTAIGKTETYLRLIRDTSMRVLVVVPTNQLKGEVKVRAANLGIVIIESPSLREIQDELPDDVWSHIEFLYASGKSVIPYLKKVLCENHPECAKLIQKYLKELDEFKNFAGHAITTHKRFLTMDVSKYDLVVIDEDILLGSIIQNKIDVSISELKKLKKKTALGSAVGKKASKALKYIQADDNISDFFSLPAIKHSKADDGITMGVDIPSFCSATRFLHRRASDKENKLGEDCITFIQPVEFKSNTKYIMVSATVDKKVCKYYFCSENMEFYECKKAKYKGVLNQDGRRPMSRDYMGKNTDIIQQIKKWTGFEDTISFKKFMKYYLGDLHFGNSAGCDYLKGKNIDVIGTPHIPEWIYKLFAYTIKCEFDTEAKIQPGVTVEHNGWRFRFMTYNDVVLRTIQFYIIESQLEQAVGRARLLRCACTVNLFSNFPLSQAIMMNDFNLDYD